MTTAYISVTGGRINRWSVCHIDGAAAEVPVTADSEGQRIIAAMAALGYQPDLDRGQSFPLEVEEGWLAMPVEAVAA